MYESSVYEFVGNAGGEPQHKIAPIRNAVEISHSLRTLIADVEYLDYNEFIIRITQAANQKNKCFRTRGTVSIYIS